MTQLDHEATLLFVTCEEEDVERDAEENPPFDSHLHGDTLDSEIAALLPPDDVLPPMRGRTALIADLRALLDAERPSEYRKGVVK